MSDVTKVCKRCERRVAPHGRTSMPDFDAFGSQDLEHCGLGDAAAFGEFPAGDAMTAERDNCSA